MLSGVDPWYHFPPDSAEASSMCSAGSHYLSFFHPGQIDAAHAGQGGCLDPCFDPRDKDALQQLQVCPSGQELQRGALIKCYCLAQVGRVTAMAASSGFSTMSFEQMSATGLVDLCQAPAYEYFVSQAISAIARCVVGVGG